VSPSAFVSDSVVENNLNVEYELLECSQLKVPVSSSDTKELELPDHVNDLFLQTVESLDLSRDTVEGLKTLLYDHRETFASSCSDLGFCPLVEHDCDTGNARPIKQSPRRPPLATREAEDEILDEMLAINFFMGFTGMFGEEKRWDVSVLHRLPTGQRRF